MRRTNVGWSLSLWVVTFVGLLGASCSDDDGGDDLGGVDGSGDPCARGVARLRECGLLDAGRAVCNVPEEQREERACSQACLARAECETLSLLLCTGDGPTSEDAATLNACVADCAEQFGFHCSGALGGDTAVPLSFVCDGEQDCADASDEAGCEQFDCGDGESVVAGWFCDGIPDCSNASDEGAGCARFSCTDGTEVPQSFQCDGADDCADGSDEAGCATARLQCQ